MDSTHVNASGDQDAGNDSEIIAQLELRFAALKETNPQAYLSVLQNLNEMLDEFTAELERSPVK